ncbi:hypothetical protein MRX96_037234 [Rhipicephalus microplus]
MCIVRHTYAFQRNAYISVLFTWWTFTGEAQTNPNPPKVLPFVIPKNLLVGERISITCSAASGTKPLTFMWIKDDATLHRGSALRITDSSDYSTLSIENLKTSDAGNYTCVVSNSGGTASHSDVLQVKGGAAADVYGGSIIRIASASKKDEADYKCHISNGVGEDLYKSVRVTVKLSTKISPFIFSKNLLVGERTSVMCATTSGDQPLTFAWLKDGKPLHQSANINIASSPQFSTLSVQKLSLGDAGNYTCAVSNAQGTVSYTDVLEVKAPPRILPFAFPRTLTVGETTSVTCTTAAGDKTFKYIWLKDGSAVHPGENVKIVTSPDISVLKIDKLTLSDAGNYTCVVSNGGGTVSHASTLEIKAPPSIAPFQFPKNLEVQQRISAMCTISVGERPLRFAWLKDGSALASGSKNVRIVDNAEYSTLHIDVLTLNSAGNYTCSVTNDAGYATYTAPLLVHEKPKLQPLVFPRNRIRVGESASALCALVAGDHDVKFRWFKENVEIGGSSVANVKVKNDKKVSVLTVEPATLQSAGNYSCTAENNYGSDANSATLVVEDPGNEAGKTAIATASGSTALIVPKTAKDAEGKYICEADNSIGAALKKIVFVKVKHAPKIQPFSFNTKVRIGDRATATCTIVTNAAPVTFTWSKDGARLQETNGLSIQETKLVSLLVIQRTETSSRGNYTCRASNVMGADQHTAELIVEAPPMWTSEPRDVSAVSGSNVTVQCTASGSPPPKITWTRTKDGGSATVPTENGRLLIHNVRVSEAGTYFCRADNGVGSAIEKSIRVIISEPPKVNPFSFTKTLSEGQSTAVTCTVTQGSKPVQLQWLKDGHEVVGSGAMKLIKHETIVVLSIEPVKVADSGNYTCVARNKYGYDRYTSSLQVNAPPKWELEPQDVILKRGETVELQCKSIGYPLPDVRWLQEGAELKRPSEDRAQVLQNGTLVIRNATSEDSGKYSCLASNGIGAALTKTVSVLVKSKPAF